MKRFLIVIGALIGLLVVAAGAVFYTAFGDNRPIVDGQELSPGIHVVKDGFVSVAMLDVASDKVALIDAGNDKSAIAILDALKKRGLGPAAVSAIFLTHGHGDHTHGCKAFPGAEIYALEQEQAVIGDAAKVTHAMHDGDAIQVGTTKVEVFSVPGHTPGSAVYLVNGVLFFGDSAGGSKEGTVMAAVRLFSKNPALNVSSLKALIARLQPRAAEVKTLEFAHTGPLEGFGPLTAFAAGH